MIDQIWERIMKHEGEEFQKIRGGKFTYRIQNNYVYLNSTNRAIPKSDIEKALKLVPLKNTVAVKNLQGPSYVYAILMDSRIRLEDW